MSSVVYEDINPVQYVWRHCGYGGTKDSPTCMHPPGGSVLYTLFSGLGKSYAPAAIIVAVIVDVFATDVILMFATISKGCSW